MLSRNPTPSDRIGSMKKSGPVAWLFYIAVRAGFAVMQAFPIDWNLQTARILAKIWAVIMPRHRQRALANLSSSFGQVYPMSRISRLADLCLESVAMFAVEAICLPRFINAFTWSRYIRLVNFDDAVRLM